MAAEMVVWDNLQRSLEREDVKALPHKGEFKRLRESVDRARGALMTLEAGEKVDSQVTPSRLEHLVALLHEADDLLDSILPSATCRRLRRAVLCVQMAAPLRKISRGLSEVVIELEHKFSFSHITEREFNKPDYRAAESKLIGREKDKDNIIDMLIPGKRNSKNTKCFVIPVVGSSGLGKSTLVRSVYEDEKVENHFDLRMWIQVSHISDEGEIIREIVESCTSRKSNYSDKSQHQQNEVRLFDILGCQNSSLGSSVVTPHYRIDKKKEDIIERRLRKEIEGKLYLLVLDDASIKQWSRLKSLLAGGATGSRILVTTNFVEVGNLAKTENDKIYKLKGLSFEDSLNLFKESALGEEEGKFGDAETERIAKSIVKTCNGVPFTLRVAGSFVCGKSVGKWSSFDNDIRFRSEDKEEDVTNHILEHSYNNLPYRLKACIGSCSLFPEDYEFNKRDLISLWMAQGFVVAQHGLSEEDTGEIYFLELSRCYFFHKVRKDDLGYIVACKMHPLMHNLARQKVALAVNIHIGDNNDVINIPKYKHASFSCNTDSSIKIPPSLLRAQTLRTLLSLKEPDCGAKLDTKECNKLILKLKYLRVLDLHDLKIQQLPDSIGSLIHLRYLDLSKNDLEILPESVTKLYNLQTLKLNSCAKLSRLEGNYGELVNLKRFKLDGCDSLTGMPLGLERLTQLQLLSRFVVGKHYKSTDPTSLVGLHALKQLNNLRRWLEIEFKGDWMENIDEAKHAELKNKSHLIELKINWAQPNSGIENENSSSLLSEEDKSRYQDILENLQPHSNLKILYIEGYKGEDFPSWAMSASSLLPNLVVVSIEGCDKCECLPPFGALRSLKRLTLRHMANVKYIESSAGAGNQEAMHELPSFFKSLEELTLHNFHKLKRWRKETMSPSRRNPQVRCFPNLAKLRIWNCPRLISMPLFQKVSDIDLRNINQSLLDNCAKNVSMITRPTSSFCIKNLQIQRCPNLNNFISVRKGLGGLSHLEALVIDRCDALAFMASELRYLTALKKLEISGCEELDLSDNGNHNMDNSDMASWMSLGTLQNLTLGGVLRNPWSSLKNLRHLTLKEIPKMKTLPEGLKNVHSLRFLWLSACYALEELPEWISNLMMLQHLRIESCPALTRLPEAIQEVTSLIKVEITGCRDLMERCKEHTGEDWHKIKNARILLHKSWRYGLMSEQGAAQNGSRFNVRTLDDVKYLIIPVLPVGRW